MQATVSGDGRHPPAADPPARGARRPRGRRERASRPRATRKRLTPQQRVALAVGGVGTTVLGLSVWECTSALSSLTGMPTALSGMLAVGIDAGMVAAEMAAIVAAKGSESYRWANAYIVAAVVLSVLLNGTAAASHATGWLVYLAAAVGGVVPLLVHAAGRVAGALWTGR
jgi:hypothetical protein